MTTTHAFIRWQARYLFGVACLCWLGVSACNRSAAMPVVPTVAAQPSASAVVAVPDTPDTAGRAAAGDAMAGTVEGTLVSGGETRHYLLHVPASYRAGVAVPLVLNFHGFGSNARQEERVTGMSAKADTAGFIVVYPDGLDATWHPGRGTRGDADVRFIRELVAWIEGAYSIAPERIYATGISNGGGMANRVGCDMADVIAAIAPDSGAYNFWQDCAPTRPVPVLAFHGLDDQVIPYAGGTPPALLPPIETWAEAWAARNGCAATPSVTTPVDTVTLRTWSSCRADAEVLLYTLANHGHSWPGSPVMPPSITSQALDATDVLWEFFVAHPMR